MIEGISRQFLNPDNRYRGKPFWAWNGKLDRDELIRQIHIIKDMGFGGFFMHSRVGLATEYMGGEWMDLIGACADEAAGLGLEAWLYDEDRWPSGTAGGMVTQYPEYRLKFLSLQVIPMEQFRWEEGVVAAFSCGLEGVSFFDCHRIFPENAPEPSAGRSALLFKVVEAAKSGFYNGYTYVDTLNGEATAKFIELTHEKYRKWFGQRFGKDLIGIFTDEPHRGALLDGFSTGLTNGQWCLPWTYTLFDEFRRKYGYDLMDRLPELFLKPGGIAVSQVKWNYVELLQQMFLDNYAKPIHQWCKENNLLLTGHVLHEDSLTAQTAMCGSVMRYYEHMDVPGVDVLTENNSCFWIVKQLASAARQLGQSELLSELYGCTGWHMGFEGHKNVGDWQALLGINVRCQHLLWYTMEGEAKRDCPGSIFYQSAWWRDYAFVETYFSRIGLAMSQGERKCEVLVINPVESVWCQVYCGWSSNLSTLSEPVKDLERQYAELFTWLSESRIDFDYADEEMLYRLWRVETDKEGRKALVVGKASYRLIIIAGMTTICSTTLEIVGKFIKAGGTVLFAGDPPGYVDALPSSEAIRLAHSAVHTAFDNESVLQTVMQTVQPDVMVTDTATGKPINDVWCQFRTDGSTCWLLALNINRRQSYGQVEIAVRAEGFVEEWRCDTGEQNRVQSRHYDGFNRFVTDFSAGGKRLFVLGPELRSLPYSVSWRETERRSLNGPFAYSLSEPNVCVLDFAEYSICGESWQKEQDILRIDRAVRDRFGMALRGGEMPQPWFSEGKPANPGGQIAIRFHFSINEKPAKRVLLGIERPELHSISINGRYISSDAVSGWWVDQCIKTLPVPDDFFVIGDNQIELDLHYSEDSGLEAIYLLGEFAVRLEGRMKTIEALPEMLLPGDLASHGLPFYSGAVLYNIPSQIRLEPDEHAFLCFGGMNAACVNVSAAEAGRKTIAWQPYEADITKPARVGAELNVETVLTRRNTFGPLHEIPWKAHGYSNGNFITDGDRYSEAYLLAPSGLPDEIWVSIRKEHLSDK